MRPFGGCCEAVWWVLGGAIWWVWGGCLVDVVKLFFECTDLEGC